MSLGRNRWEHGLQTVCFFGALLLAGALLPARAAHADIVWEDHFSDEQMITQGTTVTASNGVNVTLRRRVFSDNDGGTFDLDPYTNSDYITFESGQLGGHFGHISMSMNNDNNDPADFVRLTLRFDQPVTNLSFSLLDIDSGSWDDGVEVFYNGRNNVRDNAGITVVDGSYNGVDNETYMHGWEGYGNNAGNGQTLGNIDFDFGGLEITRIRIKYFSTDDANSNPGGQIMGLSDLTFTTAVPEPGAIGCMIVFGVLFSLSRLRQSFAQRVQRCNSFEQYTLQQSSPLFDRQPSTRSLREIRRSAQSAA